MTFIFICICLKKSNIDERMLFSFDPIKMHVSQMHIKLSHQARKYFYRFICFDNNKKKSECR